MKAQTYHPFTVGRQARKGGGGSVPSGLVAQVEQNTHDISELSTEVSSLNKVKVAVAKVTDATFVYNDPSEDPGLHSRRVRVSNCRPIKVLFEGFYHMVNDVEERIWTPITFKAPGGSMIGEVPTYKGFEVSTITEGDLDHDMEEKNPLTVLAKETYNNGYTLFRAVAMEQNYNNSSYWLDLEIVLDSTGTTTGSTEQSIQELYDWPEGSYAKFTILYI